MSAVKTATPDQTTTSTSGQAGEPPAPKGSPAPIAPLKATDLGSPGDESSEVGGAPDSGDAGQAQAESYEALVLPDGSEFTDEQLEELKGFAAENGLSPEAAQAVLDRESAVIGKHQEQLVSDWEAIKAGWDTELKADKELGGKNLPKTLELAAKVLSEFAPDGWGKRLKETGYLREPGLIRMLHAIGQKMAEPETVPRGEGAGKVASTDREQYAKWFPKSEYPGLDTQ